MTYLLPENWWMKYALLFLFLFLSWSFNSQAQSFDQLLDSALHSKSNNIDYFQLARRKIKSGSDSINFLTTKTRRSFYDLQADSTLYYGALFLKKPSIDQVPLQSALVCRWMSRTYLNLGVYEESLSFAQQSLQWAEKAGDINAACYQLADISVIHHDFNDFSSGVEYGKRCFTTAVNGNAESKYKAYCLNAVGINFDDWEKPDSALAYHLKILELQPAPDSLDIIFTFNNIGNTLKKIGRYGQAEPYFHTSLKLARKGSSAYNMAGPFTNLGYLKTKQRQFDLASMYFDSALYYALKSQSIEKIRDTYFDLYTFNKERGNLNAALEYQDKFYVLKDSIFKSERLQTVSELEARYQASLKDKQLLEQETRLKDREAQFNKALLVTIFLVILIGMLTIILLLNRSRYKRKQQLLQKESEIKMQQLSIQTTISSQESERRRFAQDLHDGMGQLITSLRLLIHRVNGRSTLEERVKVVEQSEKLIEEMQSEIRGIAFNLMPQVLIQQGLVSALQEMAIRITGTGRINLDVKGYDIPQRMPELVEISLYRIIQEWISNVLKYAQATAITIQLVGHDNEVTITIEDNGVGFDARLLEGGRGNGWTNIKSRTKLVEGEVEVDSTAGRNGTTLIVKVPKEQTKLIEANIKIPNSTDSLS